MKRKLTWLLNSRGVEIVEEDDALMVLDKPSNLLVLPDRFNQTLPNLSAIIREELGEIFVVHRIDRETSGLIVFAKTAEAHAGLNHQFEGREVEKIYHAIVLGMPSQNEGTIDAPLSPSPRQKGVMVVDEREGKEAVTEYKVLEEFKGYAFVEARPKTGRTHQIRVHLQSTGTPILGDLKYGGGEGFFLSAVKPGYKGLEEERPLLNRTALHAAGLSFFHPSSGERLSFTLPLPKDMKSVLKYLRKFRKG
ncbi:MAG: RluA family pseudouridine synthase [Ignavibacteriales bacterium]|nr:RluA family pseudouridine synthase [Ignavibacteriales bacterium]